MDTKIRLMIVDDRQSARRGLAALLSLLPDIELVGAAANGRDALRLAAEQHPDVILMDIQMPEMDGLQATELIKQQQPDVKIIGLSMYPIYRSRAIAAGVDDFLVKGCAAEQLQETIAAVAAKPVAT